MDTSTAAASTTATTTAPAEVRWPAADDTPRTACGSDVRLEWERR